LTGDLLPWDQNGYAATKTRIGFLTLLPWVGQGLLKIAIGGPGPALGHLTLTRFFALHIGLFASGFVALLIVRGVLARRASAAQVAGGSQAVAYWPRQAWRGAVACLVVLGIILAMSCQHVMTPPHAGVPLLSPADTDPANAYAAARPEWFLVGIYEFAHFFNGQWQIVPIFIVPGLLLCLLLAMPFLAQYRVGQIFNTAFTAALLAAVAGMTYYSSAKDRADPAFQKAIAISRRQAARIGELIRHDGIPPTGAITLLRNDPKTQGPRLFAQQCSVCHNHAAAGRPTPDDIIAEKPSAPNLAGYASREWIAGLLDPKKINGPQYFGNTKLRGGKMAGFVKDNLTGLDASEKKNLEKVIMALSAEAHLPFQRQLDVQDAEAIQEGRKLMVEDFGCTDCHKFRHKGKLGDAPELTGYGSPPWIAGIIRNPAAAGYYGKLNDRMPAYAASGDSAQNTLNPHQIEMLTDWLRGEWYEEGENDE
jgi:ubiquinol-cytochrome c reductase cytochrome b subunit